MLVTDIKKIDDKRSCLYLDYEAFGPLYASDIRRLKLTVGSETDAEKMQQFRSEYFFKRAMNKAVTAIKYSEKCEYDIRQKLKELCYDEEVIDTTLDKLKKYKYIIFLMPIISLILVCFVSPVNAYFRYALGVVFSIPIIVSIMYNIISEKRSGDV